MSNTAKILLLEAWYFIGLPIMGWMLVAAFGQAGAFLYLFLFVIWCWELFAFANYRYCRQEEFVHLLQTAAATQAPVEAALRAYLEDRPREQWYRFWVVCLLFFVFPGYYWIHRRRSFDSRIILVLALLENGVSLAQALRYVPGVVSRQTALAVTVGQFSGRLTQALTHLPDRQSASPWLELAPRLLYPLSILAVLIGNVAFMTIFLIPRYEKMFEDFHLRLPAATDSLIASTRLFLRSPWIVPLVWLLSVILINVLLFSSRARWYCPLLGRLYRMYSRGQFLQTLGVMLETGKPLPEILDNVHESGLLAKAVDIRAERLAADLSEGRPLAESLARHGLATRSLLGLIGAAERAQNLPWALQELGATLVRRSARLSYRISMVVFPLTIFACACLIGFVAVAMFSPLVKIMEGMHGH
jgi:type II secretory pathway component PulF